MSIDKDLLERAENKCELCGSDKELSKFIVAPKEGSSIDECACLCATCQSQIESPDTIDLNHWRCLNDSMWNPNPAVQVLAWRMLNKMKAEGWPQDLLDMMYLEDETLSWAKSGLEEEKVRHVDANGVELNAGDNVVLIKDLKVKGSSMVAKQGTLVQRISLDHDNEEYIEGRVNDQMIVILTKYVKKR